MERSTPSRKVSTGEAEKRASDCEHRGSVRPEYSETLRLKERGVKRGRKS